MSVAQKPEVAYLHKPVRKDVEEEPPDKLGRLEGHDLLCIAVGAVLPSKGDLAAIKRKGRSLSRVDHRGAV